MNHKADTPSIPTSSEGNIVSMIPLYHRGEWSEIDDVKLGLPGEFDNLDSALLPLGFECYFEFGHEMAGLKITVHRRRGESPAYLFGLWGVNLFEFLAASDLPDMMDLLTRWAPLTREAAIATVVENIYSDLHDFQTGKSSNMLQLMSAHFRRGADRASKWESQEVEEIRRAAAERYDRRKAAERAVDRGTG